MSDACFLCGCEHAKRIAEMTSRIAELETEVKSRVLPAMSGRAQWGSAKGEGQSTKGDYKTAAREVGIRVGGCN